jgi:excisionase family DNA binding protein
MSFPGADATAEPRRPFEEPEHLLTRGQVAELLQVSERTVQRLVQRGELAEIRITQTVGRFALADVEAFLSAKREQRVRDRTVAETFRGLGRSRPGRENGRFIERARAMRP